MLSSFSSRRLQCETLLRGSLSGGSYAAEFLYQLAQLGSVVIDVFIAVLRVEFAGQFGGFVGRNFLGRSLDVVTDLVPGFVNATAGESKLVSSGAVARGASNLRPV